eukprot:m.767814 g.767814  ORF g.767814 m.767814 type:complete len:80 (-) comp23227_c0_seq45:338-577(-)
MVQRVDVDRFRYIACTDAALTFGFVHLFVLCMHFSGGLQFGEQDECFLSFVPIYCSFLLYAQQMVNFQPSVEASDLRGK